MAAPASAQLGPYLLLEGASTSINLDDVEANLDSECSQVESLDWSCSYGTRDSSFGYAFGLGVNLDFLLGGEHGLRVELAQFNLGEYEWWIAANDQSSDQNIDDEFTVSMEGTGVHGIYAMPLSERLEANLTLGMLNWDVASQRELTHRDGGTVLSENSTKQSATGTSPYFGAAVAVRMGERVSLRGGFRVFTDVGDKKKTGQGDVSFLSAGLLFHF